MRGERLGVEVDLGDLVDRVDLGDGVEGWSGAAASNSRTSTSDARIGYWLLAIGYWRSAWVAGEKTWREVF
jgi:hypothetical protein